MLTKSDIKSIKNLLKPFTTKSDLIGLAKQTDLLEVKEKLEYLTSFSQDAIGNILEWTQEIHDSLVKKSLPERVKQLEQIIKTS